MYFEQRFFRPIKRDSSDPVATARGSDTKAAS